MSNVNIASSYLKSAVDRASSHTVPHTQAQIWTGVIFIMVTSQSDDVRRPVVALCFYFTNEINSQMQRRPDAVGYLHLGPVY